MCALRHHSEASQAFLQLLWGLHLDGLHAQLGGAFQVQGAIVNEAAICW